MPQMQKTVSLKLLPSEAADEGLIRNLLAKTVALPASSITGYHITRRSIDARGKQVWILLSLLVFINEPKKERLSGTFSFRDVRGAPRQVVIVGAGPAGLFAALKLLEVGIRPVILERGKDVRSRRRDLALLNRLGTINPDSNYCFGEGGAGTYSDGKLYTRSSKRGSVSRILDLFVHFGADERILYDAHPHIGTNKLPEIITSMRRTILQSGGEIFFEKRVVDLLIHQDRVIGVKTADGDSIRGDACILATGHSARDVFELLARKNISIESKPFALGVRIEHPQSLIDSAQYHRANRGEYLPPASYSLVQQVDGKGVFSFCMCPGGIIAPASTSDGELVVNGWSPSKRNNPFANSGIVVAVGQDDAMAYFNGNPGYQADDPLLLLRFQQEVERKAYAAGGGKFVAPAQRMVDFANAALSPDLPACSYVPGVRSCDLREVLPGFIYHRLQAAFRDFGKKMKGYFTNEALVVATESRTSSPVRVPRNAGTLNHPQLENLYPCGEGAGYAGGIVSAAMDGENVASQVIKAFSHR